ncbi:hypothetical protein [Candidatus Cryosericum terrychapinii]|uniref:TPM domain-containing protein n=1 Tax=Candidatus Cryosericum terrychapinii TaxID=2290919 RepID=A0A398CYT0_9BACT|nr:hypothetical protein [Candidatus Cryosericum terrychapinii]RIE05678.1 hypothetical protein SMC7_05860 [Candidatus Cryosericum terrychapinii]
MGRGGGSGGRSSGGSGGGSRSSGGRSSGSTSGGRSSGSFGGSSGGPSFGSRRSGDSSGGRSGGGFGGPFGGGFGSRRSGDSFGGGFGGFFGGGPAGPSLGNSRPSGVPFGGGRSYGGGRSRGCGCLTLIVVLIVIGIAIAAITASHSGSVSNSSGGSTEIMKSTVARKALPRGSVNETGYYTDQLGWIDNQTQLLAGLKHFYQKTGVQPYLYITDTINGSHSPTASDLDKAANSLYDKLFTDEAHLLLVFFEYDNSYMDRYVCGTQAKTVIDNEAANILLDYVDRYYYDSNLSEGAFFSKAFSDAADRIMEVTRSPWIIVFVVLGVVVLMIIMFAWWRRAINQKNLEAKQTEEMLKTPLEKFGDTEAEELTKKYEDNQGKPDH